MKLTKTKLKQIIKEELEEAFTAFQLTPHELRGDLVRSQIADREKKAAGAHAAKVDQLVKDAQYLYSQMSDTGKERLTDRFEATAAAWREGMGA